MLSGLELVVFDMAGTTVAVTEQVPEAFREAFGDQGISLSDEEINSIRGKAKRDAIADLLARHGRTTRPGEVEQIHAVFQDRLSENLTTKGVTPIPGAGDTFSWLRAREIRIALTTGFERPIVRHLLAGLGWERVVDTVVCSADVARGRPAPDLIFEAMERTGVRQADRVAAVGDTRSDLQAAEAAGVRWMIGVLSGAHSRVQLEACSHTSIIGSVAGLPALFSR